MIPYKEPKPQRSFSQSMYTTKTANKQTKNIFVWLQNLHFLLASFPRAVIIIIINKLAFWKECKAKGRKMSKLTNPPPKK